MDDLYLDRLALGTRMFSTKAKERMITAAR